MPLRNKVSFLDRFQVFIRRSEQPVLAGLVVLSFAGIVIYYWSLANSRNGIIDIDDALPQKATYGANLNTADWPELANLPGIGEKLAKSIVHHRIAHGPFESLESLTDVNGIGPHKLNKIIRFLLPLTTSPIADRPTE